MLNLKKKSIVYVYCPAGLVTGGAELLHQLVDRLNSTSVNSFIVYSDRSSEVTEAYSGYNIKVSNTVNDDSENVVVFYETSLKGVFEIKNAKKIIWWLSVDNYFYSEYAPLPGAWSKDRRHFLRLLVKRILKMDKNIGLTGITLGKLKKLNILHCYQSEYAKDFLKKNGFVDLAPLTDYLNRELTLNYKNIIQNVEREDIVLYNPKKGLRFTQKLIASNKFDNIKWIPLQGFDRKGLVNIFRRAKLYVDFGYHPGKDRLPRETAINGCCIITGRQGSANYYEDIAIDDCYKFNGKEDEVSDILDSVYSIIHNYSFHSHRFTNYREKISVEEAEFCDQVKKIFNVL